MPFDTTPQPIPSTYECLVAQFSHSTRRGLFHIEPPSWLYSSEAWHQRAIREKPEGTPAKTFINTNGYSIISYRRIRDDGKFLNTTMPEGRAVWLCRYGDLPEGWEVHHINEDPCDNRVSNLIALSPKDHTLLTQILRSKNRVGHKRLKTKKDTLQLLERFRANPNARINIKR